MRTQSLLAFAAQLQQSLELASAPEILTAPPSKAAVYPACAIVIDGTELWLSDDDVPVDAIGNPLVGTDATLDVPASFAAFDDQTILRRAGCYRMHGRIFVATRLPEQRTEFEEQVLAMFMVDPGGAMGRIVFNIDRPTVLGRQLSWSWPAAAFIDDSHAQTTQWTSEFVFAERVWSWIRFDIDVDALVPVNAPVIKTIELIFDAEFLVTTDPNTGTVIELSTPGTEESYSVANDGSLTKYP